MGKIFADFDVEQFWEPPTNAQGSFQGRPQPHISACNLIPTPVSQ